MLKKIANSIEMSFEIPDSEKEIATEASMRFEGISNSLNFALKHLDIMYEPFKKHSNISTESVINNRGLLNRFAQKAKQNFEDIKKEGLLAIKKLNYFSTGDSDIQELINSFVDSMEELGEEIATLLNVLMNDYRSGNFRNNILSAIDSVRNEAGKLDNLIWDRIIEHIDTNILAKNWMDNSEDVEDMDSENKGPIITELFEQRQRALFPESFPGPQKDNQSMNASDAQKAHYPDSIRTLNIGEFGE